jgi:hypothetical protein
MVPVPEVTAVPEPPQPPPPADEDESSAGTLLEKGFLFFHQDQPQLASDSFRAAISTGNLNDAGRALAYWHIAEAERRLHHEDDTADALASFVVVAQEVIDVRTSRRFAVDENGDFVDHFNLPLRIAEARAFMNAVWARRQRSYGRSLDNPVVAGSVEEIEIFIRVVSPCSGSPDRAVQREELESIDGVPVTPAHVERITVFCSDASSVDQFFVVVPATTEPAAPEPQPTTVIE